MLKVDIPGVGIYEFEVLVLDYNGTIALDGKVLKSIKAQLARCAECLEIVVITADTFGSVREQCRELPVHVKVLETTDHTREKADFLKQWQTQKVLAIGNGSNDQQMLYDAGIGVAVIGSEGCSVKTLNAADVVVQRIEDALDLILNPKRLVATLRR